MTDTDDKSKEKQHKKGIKFVKEVISIVIWVIILLNSFVLNIADYFAQNYASTFDAFSNFREEAFFLIVVIFFALLFLRFFRSLIIYVILYPLLLFGRLIGVFLKLVVKNWDTFLIFSPALVEIFRYKKRWFFQISFLL